MGVVVGNNLPDSHVMSVIYATAKSCTVHYVLCMYSMYTKKIYFLKGYFTITLFCNFGISMNSNFIVHFQLLKRASN